MGDQRSTRECAGNGRRVVSAIRTDSFLVIIRYNNSLLPASLSAIGTVGWMLRAGLAESTAAGDLVAQGQEPPTV